MIDSSSGGTNHVSGSKPTGAAREHAVLERGSQPALKPLLGSSLNLFAPPSSYPRARSPYLNV